MNVWSVWMGFISVKGTYAKFSITCEKKYNFFIAKSDTCKMSALGQGKLLLEVVKVYILCAFQYEQSLNLD